MGAGVPLSYKEAVRYYRLAAEQGNAEGLSMLGVMYATGQGVPKDFKKADKYFLLAARRGAEQGNVLRQYELGERYLKGDGVPQNYVLAYMWENIAVAHANATNNFWEKKAFELRSSAEKLMTPQQIEEAQDLSVRCTANKFKGC